MRDLRKIYIIIYNGVKYIEGEKGYVTTAVSVDSYEQKEIKPMYGTFTASGFLSDEQSDIVLENGIEYQAVVETNVSNLADIYEALPYERANNSRLPDILPKT